MFKLLDKAILLSPLVVLLSSIFNFTDTKFILSRLIVVVGIYCLIFHREAFKENMNVKTFKPFLVTSITVFIYFIFMHLYRDDNPGLPRTLITCLAYLVLVPWKKIQLESVYWIVSISAVICGANALYESIVMGIYRVGIATNPIPYALYCSFLVLFCTYLMLTKHSLVLKAISLFGTFGALLAIILSDVRGVLIFIPISTTVLIYMQCKSLSLIKSSVIVMVLISISYFVFEKELVYRIEITKHEFTRISNGDFGSSIGARLSLWDGGIKEFMENPLLGTGDVQLQISIAQNENSSARIFNHLHSQYFDLLARYGFLGFLLIFLWLLPAFIYKDNNGIRITSPLLASLAGMLMLAGLTDVPFHHTHIVYMYTIVVGILLLKQEQKEEPSY